MVTVSSKHLTLVQYTRGFTPGRCEPHTGFALVSPAAVIRLGFSLAERVQALGGVAIALAHDVDQETRIARAPRGRESATNQLRRLLDVHELSLEDVRPFAPESPERGDSGTNDLIVSQVVRANELQSWYVGQHLAARSDTTQV